MTDINFEKTQIETWAEEFKQSFKEYIETEAFKNQIIENGAMKFMPELILERVVVSEINYEIWIKDMLTGTQAFFDKEGHTKKTIEKIITDFAWTIAEYEYGRSLSHECNLIDKPLKNPDEN